MRRKLAHLLRRVARVMIGWSTKLDPPAAQFDPAGFRDAGLLADVELAGRLSEANAQARHRT